MAADASRKVVLVRKKAQEPKGKPLEPEPLEPMVASTRSGPTEKQRAKRRRQSEIWRETHPGLRWVQFVVDIELWDRFVARCCATYKPNVVFTRMIHKAVMTAEKTEAGDIDR
jgi:hypothetical protein